MSYGRVINGEAVDVTNVDPAALFHPEIASQFVQLPDEVRNGWTHVDGEWAAPELPEPGEPSEAPPVPPAPEPARRLSLTPAEFRNSFSAFEEVAINDFAEGAADEVDPQTKTIRKVVGVFFDRVRDPHLTTVDLGDPRNLAGLGLLVDVGILTPERRAVIATGLPA